MSILSFLVRLIFIYIMLSFFLRGVHFLIRLFLRRGGNGGGSGVRKTNKRDGDVIDAEYKEVE